jgi:hypothetical protein
MPVAGGEAGLDIPSLIAVLGALVLALSASWFAWRFTRTTGGELGAAFRWVYLGVLLFAVTRIDDALKMGGIFARMHIDYQRVIWLPHSLAVLGAWLLIAIGFSRMARVFSG